MATSGLTSSPPPSAAPTSCAGGETRAARRNDVAQGIPPRADVSARRSIQFSRRGRLLDLTSHGTEKGAWSAAARVRRRSHSQVTTVLFLHPEHRVNQISLLLCATSSG